MYKKTYKIAYLSLFNPFDKRINSGIHWQMINALKQNGNEIGTYFPSGFLAKLCLRILYRVYIFLYKNKSMFYESIMLTMFYGAYFSLRILFKKYDFIFISRGSPIIPFLKTNIPIIYTSDTTFNLMVDYYDGYNNISESQQLQGEFKESRAIACSQLVIYPSAWAAKSAITHYGADPKKIVVIPSGANFDEFVPNMTSLSHRLPSAICKVLFVGRDWGVKGGEIAVNAVKRLNENNIPTTLTVIGCKPPFDIYPDWLEVVPFLDKNKTEDANRLAGYFKEAHFFMLPTRNETFGLVFAEACAYGLPILATDTGGVSTCVEDGKNGYLFDLVENGEGYAAKIAMLWEDKKLYSQLSMNARNKYDNLLNWRVWADSVQAQLDKVMALHIAK